MAYLAQPTARPSARPFFEADNPFVGKELLYENGENLGPFKVFVGTFQIVDILVYIYYFDTVLMFYSTLSYLNVATSMKYEHSCMVGRYVSMKKKHCLCGLCGGGGKNK